MINHKNGIALIAVILLIVIVSVAGIGIAGSISNNLFAGARKALFEQAYFAAQYGIYAALDDYLHTAPVNYWKKVSNGTVLYVANASVNIGEDSNFLLVDASDPQIPIDIQYQIRRVGLSNINETQSITVNSMKVEWAGCPSSFRLRAVSLNKKSLWVGNVKSGTNISLGTGLYLGAMTSATDLSSNRWVFNQVIPKNATILVTFYFSDGSLKRVFLLNNGRSGNYEFSIKATAWMKGATGTRRTIEAVYDVGVNKITAWRETGNHI